jgi:hypothetical protein
MTTKTYVPVTDVTLAGLGVEDLLDVHRDLIASAMVDQEEGRRAKGDAELTIKLKIGQRDGTLRYHITGSLKLPGYATIAQIGHLARDADGKPKLRMQHQGDQILIPGLNPRDHGAADIEETH